MGCAGEALEAFCEEVALEEAMNLPEDRLSVK